MQKWSASQHSSWQHSLPGHKLQGLLLLLAALASGHHSQVA
jgi:hypothetical protein